mmetsp:Transcript_6216/g.11893  ORF Transcript_6216/g.11893 Transcript_6216/m.11893 type:complete len:1492 (-) Transcript_6216:110-4585(-)
MIPSRPAGTGSSAPTPRGHRVMHSPIASRSKGKSIQHGSETVKKSPDRGIQNTSLDSVNNIITTGNPDHDDSVGAGAGANEDWTPENDAILLLRSRLQVHGRELVFIVRQYLPPASFLTVQIQQPQGVGGGVGGLDEDWCAFFPVTTTMMSMLAMWSAHPSFENKAKLGTWLIQAMRLELDPSGNILKSSFDEALLESACFQEFQNFYDVLARRIQFFFRKHQKKMARLLKQRKRKGTRDSPRKSPVSPARQQHMQRSRAVQKPDSTQHASQNKSAPPGLVNFFTHFSAAATQRGVPPTSPRAMSSPHKKQGSSSKNMTRVVPGPPQRSPVRRPRPPAGRTQSQINRALHAYFPPLPISLTASLQNTPLQPSDFVQDSSSVVLPDPDGSAYDKSFNKSLDYFHDSIMSHVMHMPPVQLEDSDGDDDEELKFLRNGGGQYYDDSTLSDTNSMSFYPSHGMTLPHNTNDRGDKHNLLLVSPNAATYSHKVEPSRIGNNASTAVNLSTAIPNMVIDEQIKRKTRKRDVSQLLLDQFLPHHHRHASRIQELWRKGAHAVVRSNRIKTLIQFLKSEKKLIDSSAVKDALLDCLESGKVEIATTMFERIEDIVKTYDKKTANDYAIYYPQNVEDFSLLVDIVFAFVSVHALLKSATRLFVQLIEKNPDDNGSSDFVPILGSAGACDLLMVALNRHASTFRKNQTQTVCVDDGSESISLCKDIIELQVMLTCETLENQLRLTHKRHSKGALSMLCVGEHDATYEILTMALKFISSMCKSSAAIGTQYRDAGVFERLMSLLRRKYKVNEAIFIVFGFISVALADLDDNLSKECFGSALNFIVYLDCLVAHRKNPHCFKLVCHVMYRLSRKGEEMLINLTSEYFAMATSAIMADATTDSGCTAALLLLLKKLRSRHAPLNDLLESNGTNAMHAALTDNQDNPTPYNRGISSAEDNTELPGKRKDSLRASSTSSNLFAGESFGLFGERDRHGFNDYESDHAPNTPPTQALVPRTPPLFAHHANKSIKRYTTLSDDRAVRSIQYLALSRFARQKHTRDFKELHDKADILIKLIPKSNYFDQIMDAFQTSLRIGHIELVVLTLTRILTLIAESREMKNSSLVAKTFIKNPKILVDISSSFLSVTKIQILLWKIILHLPFKLDIKNEMDTLAMANVSGIFFWVLRRHVHDLDVLETCLACAARLTTSSVIMQEKFGKESGLRVLVRVMSLHNDVVRPMLSATELITNICSTNIQNQVKCCSGVGASHQLVQFMIKHLHNDMVVGAVAASILSLCGLKKNENIVILMSSKHILLYIQIIKNNLNSLHICSHMCMMLTSLSSGLGGGVSESKVHTELQQSVISMELVAMLDKLASDAANSNQEVVQTIIMLVVHLVLNFPALRLKFLIDGALRVLPRFMGSSGNGSGSRGGGGGGQSRPNTRQSIAVEWRVPVTNAAKLAHGILFAEKSSHAKNRVSQDSSHPSVPRKPLVQTKPSHEADRHYSVS